MEVWVRLLGILLRILNILLAPLFWLFVRDHRQLPPITDVILLRSACELADAIRADELTSEEIILAYINRLKEVNPFLNAVVDERYRAALQEAKYVDRLIALARKNGKLDELILDKPLLGLPFTVKESCSLEGLSNAVGCIEYAGRRAAADGEAVRLIKEAGAIPLLVSNTPELCLGWETTNLLRGTTCNPYSLDRTAGGSSGGEAALLASGASPFSVASDIAGSIRVPAAFCGVFGHKPTPGIISIAGHMPTLSDENYAKFLTVGPMTRRADDLPFLLNIMAGRKRMQLNLKYPVDLKKIEIYYMTEATKSLALIDVHKAIRDKIQDAVLYLQRVCGSKVSKEKFRDLEDSVEISVSVFFAMNDIPNMLQDHVHPKRNKSLIMELLRYVCGNASRSLQGLGFALLNSTHLFIPEPRRLYYQAKAKELRNEIRNALGNNGVLIYPVFNDLAHYHNQVFLKASGVMYTMVFNILGLPATTVPVGLHKGLPIAIQVIAAPNQDRLCLAVAKQLEIGFGGWHPPE